ncbi:MAG: DUF4190 domain-containing protein [Rhodospirillales bacterium]
MDDNSQSEGTPKPEGPEVLYVQGVSNPAAVGQFPATQAMAALICSILGVTVCCLLPPVGLLLANSALEITNQHPGHPDHGLAKAAQIVGWIGIVLLILTVILLLIYFVFLGLLVAAEG